MKRPLHCYVISAKRYCLYRDRQGEPENIAAVDTSEETAVDNSASPSKTSSPTGREHRPRPLPRSNLQRPKPPPTRREGTPPLGREAWQWILADARRQQPPFPAWPTATPLPASRSPAPTWRFVKGYNETRPSAGEDQAREGSATRSPRRPESARRPHPSPLETKPERWLNLDWYDRRTARYPIRVTTHDADGPRTTLPQHDARRRPNRTAPRHPSTATGAAPSPNHSTSRRTRPPQQPRPPPTPPHPLQPPPKPNSPVRKGTNSSNAPAAKSPTPPTTATPTARAAIWAPVFPRDPPRSPACPRLSGERASHAQPSTRSSTGLRLTATTPGLHGTRPRARARTTIVSAGSEPARAPIHLRPILRGT